MQRAADFRQLGAGLLLALFIEELLPGGSIGQALVEISLMLGTRCGSSLGLRLGDLNRSECGPKPPVDFVSKEVESGDPFSGVIADW